MRSLLSPMIDNFDDFLVLGSRMTSVHKISIYATAGHLLRMQFSMVYDSLGTQHIAQVCLS